MAASAEPPVTRNTVRSYIVPSLKRCVGSELPANSPATFNDLLESRHRLLPFDLGYPLKIGVKIKLGVQKNIKRVKRKDWTRNNQFNSGNFISG